MWRGLHLQLRIKPSLKAFKQSKVITLISKLELNILLLKAIDFFIDAHSPKSDPKGWIAGDDKKGNIFIVEALVGFVMAEYCEVCWTLKKEHLQGQMGIGNSR